MSTIIFSLNIVSPLLILMLAGYTVRYLGIIDKNTVSQVNGLLFQLFLPVLLFKNVLNSSLDAMSDPTIFIFVLIMILLSFLGFSLLSLVVEKDNARRGVMVQGIVRSNYAFFGIPLVAMLFPGQDVALASLLITVVIPVYNVATVIVLTIFGNKKTNFKNIFLGVVKNPLIIGTFSGIILLLAGIQLPTFLNSAVNDIASVGTPLALFFLGASFEFNKVKGFLKPLIITVLGKLVILPLFMIPAAALLGYRDVALASVMVIAGAPTAVSSFTMAAKMGGDGDLASAVVVFTSSLSVISIFFLIIILKSLALI